MWMIKIIGALALASAITLGIWEGLEALGFPGGAALSIGLLVASPIGFVLAIRASAGK
jgi:hypothetical protein